MIVKPDSSSLHTTSDLSLARIRRVAMVGRWSQAESG